VDFVGETTTDAEFVTGVTLNVTGLTFNGGIRTA
jgi:hypothetical protein